MASPPADAALLSITVPEIVPPLRTWATLKVKLLTPGKLHGDWTLIGMEEVARRPSISVATAVNTLVPVGEAFDQVM